MPKHVDVFIIGGGPAGQSLAHSLSQYDLNITISEPRGFGGTCTLRGCDPKRILVTVTEAVDNANRLLGKGIENKVCAAWQAMTKRVHEIIDGIPARAIAALEDQGIEVLKEWVSFKDDKTLLVGDQTYTADHIVIATGQRPAPLNIPGSAFAKTSANFHTLPELPDKVLFIGGGYIGLESAHVARRVGAEVTILNDNANPLPMFDRDYCEKMIEITRHIGVDFALDTTVTRIEEAPTGFRVSAKSKDGTTSTYEAGLVMNTAGRIPNLEKLKLDQADIKSEDKGIPVDEYFRVNGKTHIYAIGDVALNESPPLTPVANLEGEALATTIGKGTDTKANYKGLPTVVYTLPELAAVGLTESKAKKAGYDVSVVENGDARDKYNAKRTNARGYAYKTVIDKSTDKILGATLIGPRASEVINLFALAMRTDITATTLAGTPFAYPTWGSDTEKMV